MREFPSLNRICILLLLTGLFACEQNKKAHADREVPQTRDSLGYVVPKDSMRPPTVITVDWDKLPKVQFDITQTVAAEDNVLPAGTPRVVPSGAPRICILGTDSFPFPKPVPAIDSPYVAHTPKPYPALPMRMKDQVNCNVHYLEMDQGLHSSDIWKVIKDRKGNLWFGSDGNGVAMYDGKSFQHYTGNEYFGSRVYTMLEDRKGNLWFGSSDEGLTRYDGQRFTRFTQKEGLPDNQVWSLLEDRSGNLWIGTFGKGVVKYDGKTFTNYTIAEGLPDNKIMSILEDRSGNIWFGTLRGGVSKYDGKSFTTFTTAQGLAENSVLGMCEDLQGNIWFGTYTGSICKFDGSSFSTYTALQDAGQNMIWSIHKDDAGNLWLATEVNGAVKFNGETFTRYAAEEGLSSNEVRSIWIDGQNDIWIGTHGGGVVKFRDKGFRHFSTEEGMGNGRVRSIAEDRKGNHWFGCEAGIFITYDGKSFKTHAAKGYMKFNIISLLEDSRGNMWMGTAGILGLIRYDGKEFRYMGRDEGFSASTVNCMLEDREGNLWLGTTNGGVYRYDGKDLTNYSTRQGLSNRSVYAMLQDSSGYIWMATAGGGLNRFDGTTFTHFTKKDGLGDNEASSMMADASGKLWIGHSLEGICTFDGNAFSKLSDVEGLTSKNINSISGLESFPAGTGLWFGTNQGLNFYDTRSKRFLGFLKEDGLKAEDFQLNSVLHDSRNRMWWGTGKALTLLDMNTFMPDTTAPTIELSHLYLQEKFIDYRILGSAALNDTAMNQYKDFRKIAFREVAPFHNYPIDAELPHNINHLTFHFSAIDWYAPHKIRYQYKLEGLDADWSELTADNEADYRNIPPGQYTFKARAIGGAGKWSKTFEYAFRIHPPWWKTWWAYFLYISMVPVLIYPYVRYRERTLRRRQKELEEKIEEATVDIRKQKERSDELLLNILPEEVAEELKTKGEAEAKLIDNVTVLFTDFKGFTEMSEKLPARVLVNEIHECFSAFDAITQKYGIEKIKTIGDAYMAAGGVPVPNLTHARDVVGAALEIQQYMRDYKERKEALGELCFEIRIGVHTGPVVAGIVGVKKFQYDIWGDTVNTANRMESSGEVGKVNISEATYALVRDEFICTFRGELEAKGKGKLGMYYVESKRPGGK